ncbi:MAG: lysylphosphatidylglycerol synthetase family protein [Rhodobiaceae bacterium]|nr:lysylphosphatidylglycerol synthetase family protein [Rhodobiaceae bacterium]
MQHDTASSLTHPARQWLLRWAAVGASLMVFALALFALNRILADVRVGEVLAAFSSIGRDALLVSVALTALSYLTLTGYDAVALRHLHLKVPYGHTALASFTSYAFSNNIGLALLTGGSIRYRIYSLEGLTALDIAALTGISTLTFFLGAMCALGIVLVAEPVTLSAIDRLPVTLNQLLGAAMLGALAFYCVWVSLRPRALDARGLRLRLPGAGLTLSQIAIAVTDIAFASAALYVLMPAELGVEYTAFAGIFVASLTLGILAHTPGGIGVFEAMILIALPHAPPDVLLGRLILFRCVYYLLPLAVAAGMLAFNEALHPAGVARRLGDTALAAGGAAAPQLVSLLVLACGALVLLSGAATPDHARHAWVSDLLPVALRDSAHLVAGLCGVALVILARGLFRRLTRAWRFAAFALAIGAVAVVLRGFDFEEAGILVFVLFVLLGTRRGFARRGRIRAQTYPAAWIAVILSVIGFSLWLGVLAYGQRGLDPQALLQFGSHADAGRFMRTSLAVVVCAVVFIALVTLRIREDGGAKTMIPLGVRAISRASADPIARLAFNGDKRFLVDDSDTAFLMYGVRRRTWLAMGMPQGEPSAAASLLWRFRELAEAEGGSAAVYDVSEGDAAALNEIGLVPARIGDRAIVDLASAAVSDPAGSHLQVAAVPAADVRARAATFAAIRAALPQGLLQAGFSRARLSDEGLPRGDALILSDSDGVALGYASVWFARDGHAALDLVHTVSAPPDEMRDHMRALFVASMAHARAAGAATLDLGLVPPGGLDDLMLAPALAAVGPGFYAHGSGFADFDRLRAFMLSFAPRLVPRHMATPGGAQLADAVRDAGELITGQPSRRRPRIDIRAQTQER